MTARENAEPCELPQMKWYEDIFMPQQIQHRRAELRMGRISGLVVAIELVVDGAHPIANEHRQRQSTQSLSAIGIEELLEIHVRTLAMNRGRLRQRDPS
jgi:hypothetical protein